MSFQAAVLVEASKPLQVWDLELPPLQTGQVLVDIAYAGVCHTQVLEWRGIRGQDPYLPHCLGHEGSGTVVEIGNGVTKVKADDKVVLSWIKGNGIDSGGTTYHSGQHVVNAGPVTTFMRQAVISENRLTPIAETFDLKVASLIGCALPTGLGSIFNLANPSTGQSLAIFGVGGIGMIALMGASLSGCNPIIAIDMNTRKLNQAKIHGASHTINTSEDQNLKQIHEICPSGVDIAIEATGNVKVMVQAVELVRPRGGKAVIIGNAPHGHMVTLDPKQLNLGKSILGSWGGGCAPDLDFNKFCDLYNQSKLDLSLIVNAPNYGLRQINEAMNDLMMGYAVRPIIDMSIE